MGWLEKGLIDASVTSDEVNQGRPHPDLIFKVMTLTGVDDVVTVAKVGDTISDLLEGNSAGCSWVIGITTGAYSKEQLSVGPHTHLINHLSDLSSIFSIQSVSVSN
jgi:phosphoglycolate phosphatase-like HAD superfamily hydrolase